MRTTPALPSRRCGFTLIETALAVVIVAIVLLAAIGLLVPAQRAIDDVLTADQATRLLAEIEKEMSVVRPGETGVATGFDKAYRTVNQRDNAGGMLAVFFYRAQKPGAAGGGARPDGRLQPFTGDIVDNRAGEDYVIQAAVMPASQYTADNGLREAVDGRVFLARLVPLDGLLPQASETYLKTNADPNNYPEAVIPATVEFYVAQDADEPLAALPSILDGTIKPLMSLNVGFNR